MGSITDSNDFIVEYNTQLGQIRHLVCPPTFFSGTLLAALYVQLTQTNI